MVQEAYKQSILIFKDKKGLRMKCHLPIFFSVLMVGCSSAHEENNLVVDVFTEKLQKNGAAILCDQPAYTACYQITQAQCLAEVNEANQDCIQRTEKKFVSVTMDSLQDYFGYYDSCLIIEHGLKHAAQMSEIEDCLETITIDKPQMLRSLFQ